MSANYIRGGILASQSGSLAFDLNRNYLRFNAAANIEFTTANNSLFRRKGDGTGFLHFSDDTYGGVFVGLGVTSHNIGTISQDTGYFSGIRIFRANDNVDQTEIFGDKILLGHAFSGGRDGIYHFVFEPTKLSKGISMIRLCNSVESLWRCWEHLNNAGWNVGNNDFSNAVWNERRNHKYIGT